MIGSHIVPRFYLEQFAVKAKKSARTGHLWVYSTDASPRPGTAANEGRENGYFGIPRDDGSLDESLENQLQRIEDRATDVLSCVGSELFVWSLRAKQILASYCGQLYARVRARQAASFWLSDKVWSEFRDLIQDDTFIENVASRYAVPTEQVKDSMVGLADKAASPLERKKNFLADIQPSAAWMTQVFLEKQWHVWFAPESVEFITCDNPLVSALPINQKFAPGFGFARQDVFVFFPVNPRACLVMRQAPAQSRRVAPGIVEAVNEVLVYSITKNAYSRTRSQRVAENVAEFGGKLRFGENAFVIPDMQLSVRSFLESNLRPRPQGK